MSHFAKIESGIVTAVIVVEQDIVDTYDGTWVQTSYNTRGNVHYGQDGEPDGGVALRGNYAGIGYIYDADNDVFYIPKPSNSWTLDTDTWSWKSPITYPDDGKLYVWDEDVYQDNNNNGWVLVE
jgi:hypothetical protein